MELRTKLAIYAAKLTSLFIRILHIGNGATLPGYAARLIDPNILSIMSGMVVGDVIAVMGTNGKTTTNSLLRQALSSRNKTVISNQTGANMENGIISSFALAADWRGRLRADCACIEVDENASVHVLPSLKPSCIIITNLSRDQLDRYGETDIVFEKLKSAIQSVPEAQLVLNSDDVLSYSLAYGCSNPVTTYGIHEQIFGSSAGTGSQESIFCRCCGAKLTYSAFYYGHLGIWNCPRCGVRRQEPTYAATGISGHGGTYSFHVNGVYIHTAAQAAYNVYNTLSAYAALCIIGKAGQFAQSAADFNYGNGREKTFTVYGSHIHLHLAKNPVGFQQKLSLLLKDQKPKDIIIQINDKPQDGKDISWLWDVDFQCLSDANAASISISGTRKLDMGLRLKYEEIPHCFIDDIRKALKKIAIQGSGNLYVISNYSGLYGLSHMLAALQKGAKSHKTYHWTSLSRPAQFIR